MGLIRSFPPQCFSDNASMISMANTELNDGWPEMGRSYREQTRRHKEVIRGLETITSVVGAVLEYFEKVGLDLLIFLDAICWGNDHLVLNGRARYQ